MLRSHDDTTKLQMSSWASVLLSNLRVVTASGRNIRFI